VRKLYYWKLQRREIMLGERTVLMAVLNVTPDSFSDGGKYADPDRAFARAIELEEQGADIVDIGAESTRPGSARISAAEEMRRLIPVLKRLKDRLSIPVSVDTYKAEVAERALELGSRSSTTPPASPSSRSSRARFPTTTPAWFSTTCAGAPRRGRSSAPCPTPWARSPATSMPPSAAPAAWALIRPSW